MPRKIPTEPVARLTDVDRELLLETFQQLCDSEDSTGCEDGYTVVDGKYLTRLKALMPRHAYGFVPLPRIAIAVEGGCVQDVVTSAELFATEAPEYLVVDYDALTAQEGYRADDLEQAWDEACVWANPDIAEIMAAAAAEAAESIDDE